MSEIVKNYRHLVHTQEARCADENAITSAFAKQIFDYATQQDDVALIRLLAAFAEARAATAQKYAEIFELTAMSAER